MVGGGSIRGREHPLTFVSRCSIIRAQRGGARHAKLSLGVAAWFCSVELLASEVNLCFERVAVEFIPRPARHSEVGTLGLKIKILPKGSASEGLVYPGG